MLQQCLEDLAPRIRELRTRQDELDKNRVQVEAEIVAQGTQQVDVESVKSYAQDLLPLPPEEKKKQSIGVLPIVTPLVELRYQ